MLFSCGKKAPKANFDSVVKRAGVVDFLNTSVGVVDEFIWIFDDGDSSFAINPVHRYNEPGLYSVKLIAKNENGSDEVVKEVDIVGGDREDLSGHPSFSDADGYLIAQNEIVFVEGSPFQIQNIRGKALVGFYDTTNFFVDVGVVSANGERLSQSDNNTYVFSSPDSSYYFKEQVNWRVDGGQRYPTIIESRQTAWPSISGIQFNPTIDRSTTYTLSLNGLPSDADAVLYQIMDTSGTVLLSREENSSFSSYNFTSFELDTLTAGLAKVRILAYNYDTFIVDQRKIYFVNEASTEAAVEIK